MRIGSLCSGYGGLTLAVQAALGGRVAWHSEIEPAADRVLTARFPGVPNVGDMTAVDWSSVEPVDVLEGGTPCQDVSHAGKRAGMRTGTRSGLWSAMVDAIDVLRPRLVVWENVRGVLSAGANSGVEPCPLCVGDGAGSALRALGRVLGDLADLGYDARWCGLRAADMGAPHGRFRVFVAAVPFSSGWERWRTFQQPGTPGHTAGNGPATADSRSETVGLGTGLRESEPAGQRWRRLDHDTAQSAADTDQQGSQGHRELHPAPRENQTAAHNRDTWGAYGPAIRRWEHRIGRVAPAPTETGPKGSQRLSPAFVEWMMGLEPGWVTDVPGITRNDQLKMLGNGVVPQQATAAIRHLTRGE